ncbi:hypothetical protein L484_012861 [Morus notabilis]|uniref:Uncharacterized protein n=1 Tax=Morus notabilis TaxID=981085 RepID=W9RFE7_9ROSA|nr:hypothetical protein L484_012861 [Morus notabilis]
MTKYPTVPPAAVAAAAALTVLGPLVVGESSIDDEEIMSLWLWLWLWLFIVVDIMEGRLFVGSETMSI